MKTSLHTPLTLPNQHVLRNRIVKSAMSEALADRQTGRPSTELATLYKRWGKSGASVLITGNVAVSLDSRSEPGNVVVSDDRFSEELADWAQAAQAEGAQLWMQINHAGRQVARRISSQPVAPSAIAVQGKAGLFATPRALRDEEIVALVQQFATTAKVAANAGFSGVQIHAAHGYLVSQFLSPRTNQRDDRWGGSPEGRMCFLLEIVRAVRAQVGTHFPIAVKLNSADFQRGGFSEEESMQVVVALQTEGVDVLEISGGSYEQSAMMGDSGEVRKSTQDREAYFLSYAEKVRAVTTLPLLLTGGFRTVATMQKVVASQTVDLIGMARPMAVQPDFPALALEKRVEQTLLVKTKVGLKLFDDMLQILWYQAQLHRMGQGLSPDPELSRWKSLVLGFFHSYAFNPLGLLVPHRLRRKRRSLCKAGQ